MADVAQVAEPPEVIPPEPLNPIDAFFQSKAVRHLARLVGLAAAVSVGMVVVMWMSEPNYAPLYSNMSGQDSAEIADVLTSNNIEFKLDANTGSILVDQAMVAEARLKLSAQGLPESKSRGMEMLSDEQGLGTSQFIESARYNHALEAELVRSIESIRGVESARVHLAIPKQSIFIRNRVKPSASVVVKLHSGRVLNRGQVGAVVQMVASSVPLLESTEVAIVDQFGRLLSEAEDAGMAQTSKHFEYTRLLEDNYVDRIINLLQPIVGAGKVNAQVSARLDFSSVESTREAYDPERSVVRSEQITEEEVRNFADSLGIPGALSNQPPGEGTTEPDAAEGDADNKAIPGNQNRSATRNFEVDRVISHTSRPIGSIQRLSVAVIIDDKSVVADDGSITKTPYSDEDIARFNSLVKETIGFDESRGDSVSIINTSFLDVTVPVLAEIPLWQSLLSDMWVSNLAKQVFGALGLLIVYFLFGRPFLRSLNPVRVDPSSLEASSETALALTEDGSEIKTGEAGGNAEGDLLGLPNLADDPDNPAAMMARMDASYEQKLEMARTLVTEDPARVANVMKQWIMET